MKNLINRALVAEKKLFTILAAVLMTASVWAEDFNFLNATLQKAKQGDVEAQYILGCMYDSGTDVTQDYSKAVYWYRKAAEQGHAKSQYYLGLMYDDGKGVAQDYTQAAYWFRKAAEQGNANGQTILGIMYKYGRGVKQDYTQAVYWFRKAAEQGEADAQDKLGVMYDQGKGIKQDYSQAVRWYRKAAEQGHANGQCHLGYMYYYGTGVTQDYTQAAYWYHKAAEQGYAKGQYFLGDMYENGTGVTQDYIQAVFWYWKAAEQGHAGAQNNLGNMYENGTGVTQDYTQAINWYHKAADKGDADGLKNCQRLYALGYADQPNQIPAPVAKASLVDTNIPTNKTKNENTFVVIIANEEYKNVAKVPYALNDGRIFAKYCQQTLGVPANHVKLCENATYNDMRLVMAWLKNVCDIYKGDASVIFYYTGHGIPDESDKSAYLLPVDGDGRYVATGYKMDDLYDKLGAMPAKSITVLLDACFSGASRDGKMLSQAKGIAIKAKKGTPHGNTVVLAAAQGDETAGFKEEEGHGMFTYYLLKKLQETSGNVTLQELSQYIIREVSRATVVDSKLQTPCVTPSASLGTEWQNWKLK